MVRKKKYEIGTKITKIKVNIVDTKQNVGKTQVIHIIKPTQGVHIKRPSCPFCGDEVSSLALIYSQSEGELSKDGVACPSCWNILFKDPTDAQYFLDNCKIPEYLKPDMISRALK